ncbi:MAG: flavin reductase [Armatimonadetes bacterium]|nr:flavin reductase [Armatimonadota bacterium]
MRAPRVLESPVNLECRLRQIVTISDRPGGGSIVVGKVVAFHVRDDLVEKMRISAAGLAPVGRLSGASYWGTFQRERIPYRA